KIQEEKCTGCVPTRRCRHHVRLDSGKKRFKPLLALDVSERPLVKPRLGPVDKRSQELYLRSKAFKRQAAAVPSQDSDLGQRSPGSSLLSDQLQSSIEEPLVGLAAPLFVCANHLAR